MTIKAHSEAKLHAKLRNEPTAKLKKELAAKLEKSL